MNKLTTTLASIALLSMYGCGPTENNVVAKEVLLQPVDKNYFTEFGGITKPCGIDFDIRTDTILLVTDFNNDGYDDILISDSWNNEIYICENMLEKNLPLEANQNQ